MEHRHFVCRSFCLALVLALLLPCVSQAAGNTLLARRSDGFDDSLDGLCGIGDTLYLIGRKQVYAYDGVSGETTAYPWSQDVIRASEGIRDGDATYYQSPRAVFAVEDALYSLLGTVCSAEGYYGTEEVGLYRLDLSSGEAEWVEAGEIDWQPLEEELDYLSFECSCVVDDTLYGLAFTYIGDMALVQVPLDGSSAEIIPMRNLAAMCRYRDGLLLLESLYDNGSYQARFSAYRPGDKEPAALCTLSCGSGSMPSCMAQEPGSDRILMAQGGRLLALDLTSGETEDLAAVPFDVYPMGGEAACALTCGLYAAGSYDGVVVCDLNNRVEVACQLTISSNVYSSAVNDARLSYTQTHPEIAVADVASREVLEELLTRSDAIDIYLLNEYSDLRAVMERQWAAPIDSPVLNDYVSQMYPAISQACIGKEGLFAIPLDADCIGNGINMAGLDELGLTIEDVPTNWPDFLDFLGRLCEEDCPVPLVYEDNVNYLYAMLAQAILEDYELEILCGASVGYDTPELRAALEALDRLDLEAMIAQAAHAVDWKGNALFSMYESCDVDGCVWNSTKENRHFLLSISADRPARLPLSGSFALINPASQHKEEAIAFLEAVIRHVAPADLASLCPNQGAPYRSDRYESSRADSVERVEKLQAELENAEEINRQKIEEELMLAQRWLDEMYDYYWEISQPSLDWYRAHAENLVLFTGSALQNIDLFTLAYNLREAEAHPADALIAELHRQAEMSRLESAVPTSNS